MTKSLRPEAEPMDIFPRSLRENLRRAVTSGDLKREDNLEAVGEQLSDIFQCDSLDLVELVMAIEEQKGKSPTTVGDLMDLIEKNGPDDTAGPGRERVIELKASSSSSRSKHWLTRGVLGLGLGSLFSDWGHETATAILPAFLASIGAPPVALGIIE